jgi:hypothetical protein
MVDVGEEGETQRGGDKERGRRGDSGFGISLRLLVSPSPCLPVFFALGWQ